LTGDKAVTGRGWWTDKQKDRGDRGGALEDCGKRTGGWFARRSRYEKLDCSDYPRLTREKTCKKEGTGSDESLEPREKEDMA